MTFHEQKHALAMRKAEFDRKQAAKYPIGSTTRKELIHAARCQLNHAKRAREVAS